MNINNGWKSAPLGEICDVAIGKTPARQTLKYWGGENPWLSIGDMSQGKFISKTKEKITDAGVKECGCRLVEKGTLLLSFKLSIGKVGFAEIPLYTNEAIAALPIKRRDLVIGDYLYWALQHIDLERYVDKAAKGKTLNKAKLQEVMVPLPPLNEQQRIASMLDKAYSLLEKRRESINTLNTLLQSAFINLFGDPLTNQKGWEVVKIRELVSDVSYGTSSKAGSEGKFPILRMNNLTYQGGWNFKDMKYIDLSEEEQGKYLVGKGDLLFNRTNSKELVGKAAVYRQDIPMAFAGYLIRVRANKHNNTEYISGFLNSRYGKQTLMNMCKNIIGMANINAQELQSMHIPKPPLELQNKYALIVSQTEALRTVLNGSLRSTELLFRSLKQRAFNGGSFNTTTDPPSFLPEITAHV